MPEIDFFLFDLKYLFLLFPKQNCAFNHELEDYERDTQEDMAKIRFRLFGERRDKNFAY